MKKTVIIGASNNPSRYSYLAAGMLQQYGHEFVPVGLKRATVFDKDILDIRQQPLITDVDTVTLYVGPQNQENLEMYLTKLMPKRIIFNPGSENPALARRLEEAGMEVVEACTLVMLRSDQY